MAKITVRDVPEEVLARLRQRARDRGRSMEQEIRELLAESVADWAEAVDEVREFRKGLKQLVSLEDIVRWQRQSRSGESWRTPACWRPSASAEGLAKLAGGLPGTLECRFEEISMKDIDAVDGIVPLDEFKADSPRFLKQLGQSGEPLVLTEEGRPAAVILSPAAFQQLQDTHRYLEAVAAGVEDADAGRLVEHEKVEAWLRTWGSEAECEPPACE